MTEMTVISPTAPLRAEAPLDWEAKAVEVVMPDGSQSLQFPSEIRLAISKGLGSDNHCPVCTKFVQKNGWGPHADAHRRQVGDLPPRTGRPRKPKKEKVVREAKTKVEQEQPPIEDACLVLIYAYVGPKVPVEMIGDINVWVESTRKLIGALK